MDPRLQRIRETIRDIPDFPKPGILFRDITPLLASSGAFRDTIELLAERYRSMKVDHIVAIESRGFIFGGALALQLDLGLHIVRKPGKLPGETDEISYALEYGESTLQIHKGQLRDGGRTVILDDLLATGGTAAAAARLVEKQRAKVIECGFIIELEALGGREKLSWPCFALLSM